MNNDETYYKTCSKCGRPQTYCKGQCCGKAKGCQCQEYGPKVCGAIRPGEPECPYQAVIPSLTVESVGNLKDLADCFVHVSDINTTFYIDDKHRIMTTWAGLVSVNNYDFEANPLNLRSQIAYDAENNVAAIYDEQGANYIFQISDINNDYMLLENKPQINGVALEGNKTSADLGIPANEDVALVFDTVADMKQATNLVNGGYARTLGFYSVNDGGGALYKIADTGTANEMDIIAVGALYACLTDGKNARQFGAYGDGAHDDSSRLERAMAVCRDLLIPSGSYSLSNVDVPDNTHLAGEGGTVLLARGGSSYLMSLGSNTILRGIAFDGDSSSGNAIVSATLKDHITIESCTFANGAHKAIILTDTTNVALDKCIFSDLREAGVLVVPSTKNVKNVIISGCSFTNVAQQTLAYAVYFNSGDTYYVKDSVIQNCVINSAGYGGYFPGGDNNSIINCSAYSCSGWRGIWVHDSANIIIRGGTYASCGKDGVYVSKAHNVIIDGVTAYDNTNNGIGIDGDQTASGRYQTTATNKNVTVCNCLVFNNNQSGGDYCGIRVGGTGEANCIIVNNNIYDNQATPTHKRSIETVANGNGHIVTGNICGASTQSGINCPSAVVLTDNTLNGVGNGTLYNLSRSAIVGQGEVTVANQTVNNNANLLVTYNPPTGYEVVSARYVPNTSTANGAITLTAPMQWGAGVRVRLVNTTGAAQTVEGKIVFYYKLTV